MSIAVATAVAFAVAAALSFFVSLRRRLLLVAGVLVLPIALATPRALLTERSAATESARLSLYAPPPPFRWREANPILIAGIVETVPAHASVSVVNGNLETGWARWLAYSIAPRQLTNLPTRWTIVFGKTPERAGLHPVHKRAYGRDWLVER